MTEYTGPEWAHIRHRYEETQEAVADICRDAGITERELAGARKKWKWRRKNPRPFLPLRNASAKAGCELPAAASRETGGETLGDANVSATPSVSTRRSSGRGPSELAGSPPPRGEGLGVGGQSRERRIGVHSTLDPSPSMGGGKIRRPSAEAFQENAEGAGLECDRDGTPNGGSGQASIPRTSDRSSSARPPAAPPAIPRRLLATPAARRRLLERLVAAISMKLEQLERRMSIDLAKGEDTSATDHERETRAIGALIDNLEKIRELESGLAQNVGKSGSARSTDLADEADRCRRELAERLSRLVEAAAKGP